MSEEKLINLISDLSIQLKALTNLSKELIRRRNLECDHFH